MEQESFSYWISNIIMITCRITEILILIFLLSQYFKRSSQFKSAYFVFLQIGYLFDVGYGVLWVIYILFSTTTTIMMCFEWYETYFSTIWNVLLACNRCTVIVFPLAQQRIWSPTRTRIFACLLILSPFLIDGYNFINFPFSSNGFSPERMLYRESYFIRGCIVNLILTLLILIFITFAIFKTQTQNLTAYIKIERRLIYQALLSSIIILINFSLRYYSTKLSYSDPSFQFITNLSAIVYYLHNYSIISTHFIFAPSYRNAFIKFYTGKFLSLESISSVKIQPVNIAVVKV